MTPIKQRKNECSLAALCVLNGLSQADYEALSDLVAERYGLGGYRALLTDAVQYGIALVRKFGYTVPVDYGQWAYQPPASDDADEIFAGRGIAYVTLDGGDGKDYAHVIAFKDGELIDSNERTYANWDAYAKHMRAKGWQKVTVAQIFKS
jgi:hypothetical protein